MENFIPEDPSEDRIVPFFEESSNEVGVVGYSTQKDIHELEGEIRKAMAMLGGTVTGIQSGHFPYHKGNKKKRYAFRIFFIFQGAEGRMDVAALPIRKETEARVRQAKRHALYSIVNRLEALFNSQLVMPGDLPLMPHFLDREGRTMLERIQDEGVIAQLAPPREGDDAVEGEFTESED